MTSTTNLTDPAEYNALPDFDSIVPKNEDDEECLREVRDVLERHGKLNRFGIVLLHKHFDLKPGEVLIESTNEKERTHAVKVVNNEDVPPCGGVETAWILKEGNPVMRCYSSCSYRNGEHRDSHVTTGD